MAVVTGTNSNDILNGTNNNDTVKGLGGNDELNGLDGDDILDGGAGNDTISSGIGNDLLTGGIGLDTLAGGIGNNRLDGGAGADSMTGGDGDDTYVVDSLGDIVFENAGEGIDLVEAGISYTLVAEVDDLILTGTAVSGTGNGLDNSITGTKGANKLFGLGGDDALDGGLGADSMTGGTGNDIYNVDNSLDKVFENAGEGTDAVYAFATYTLSANIEALFLFGGPDNLLNGTGNADDNTITGTDAVNTLDGGGGADELYGGLGNDVYVFDNAGDTAFDSGGADTVRSSVPVDLLLSTVGVDNVLLTGTVSIDAYGDNGANTLTGNDFVNQLFGRDGDDTLNGGAGTDIMLGGIGDDVFIVDNAGDQVLEFIGDGTADAIRAGVTYDMTAAQDVEILTLTGTLGISGTGNAIANTITGNGGANTLAGAAGDDTLNGGGGNDLLQGGADNDTLDGGAGTDTMQGGTGDDVYIIAATTGKTITELAGEGADTVQASVNYTLGAEVDNLLLTGAANLNGTGNALGNTLTGNTGNNTLNGGAGADALVGGGGNDIYIVDNAGDSVSGTGVVHSSVDWDLGVNTTGIDILLLLAGATNGTGDGDANTITGNAAVNLLSGGAGDDVLFADATDLLDGGADSDTAAVGFTATLANINWTGIENITLTGTGAFNATGDGGANVLTGNSAKNTLDGGLGDDTYVITSTDVIIDAGGTDTVRAGFTYTLIAAMENLLLTGTGNFNGVGNASANTLTGNAGNNTLDGLGGLDTLMGGAGNDVYIDGAGVTVIENPGEGTDTVRSGVSYILGLDVENLVMTGAASIDGTGNLTANSLTGNSGNNTLDGLAGADVMAGGAGNDVFLIDDAGDVVTDSAGFDAAIATDSSATIGSGVENLTLVSIGVMNINGTGNTGANIITGTDGNNTLDGRGGNDTLVGGLGDDTYVVDALGDTVFENLNQGQDTVLSSRNYTLGQDVEALTLTGAAIQGTGNAGDNTITGTAGFNKLYGLEGDDTLSGDAGDDHLYGGLGDDVLEGGAGLNKLYGGQGADAFKFDDGTSLDAPDYIYDYNEAEGDVIDISDLLAGAGFDALLDDVNDWAQILTSAGGKNYVGVDLTGSAGAGGWTSIAQFINAVDVESVFVDFTP